MNRNMYEVILRVVYDYAKNNKAIDRAFLDKIVAIIVSLESVNDYVRELKIDDVSEDSDTLASYNRKYRKLTIYWQDLMNYANMALNSRCMNTMSGQLDYYKCVAITIYHELIHARQEKEKNEERETIKAKIIKLASSYVEDESKIKYMMPEERDRYLKYTDYLYEKYDEYHDYAPQEREANIEEFTLSCFITSELNKRFKGLNKLQHMDFALLKKYFLLGYDEGLVPADYYFEQLGLSKEWELLIPKTNELSTEEKVIYGLDVPMNEVKAEYDKFVRQRIR